MTHAHTAVPSGASGMLQPAMPAAENGGQGAYSMEGQSDDVSPVGSTLQKNNSLYIISRQQLEGH